MTIKEIYRDAQRKRTRARKEMNRLGRGTHPWWVLRREESDMTWIIMRLSVNMQEKRLGL